MTMNVFNFKSNILIKKFIPMLCSWTMYESCLVLRNAVENFFFIFTQQCCNINKYYHTCTYQMKFVYFNNYKTPLLTSLFYIRALISLIKFAHHESKFLIATGYCICVLMVDMYIIILVPNKIYIITLVFHYIWYYTIFSM